MSKGKIELFRTPYMWAWGESVGGDLYTHISTASAVVVLPFRFTDAGHAEVLLLKQQRPEALNEVVIKTVGGYVAENENDEKCVRRNLLKKMGVEVDQLILVERMLGYSVVATPITVFFAEGWREVGHCQPECARMVLPLVEALKLAKQNKLFDEASKVPVMRLAIELAEQGKFRF